MKVLILRLQAPLMSFGAPMIDQFGVIQPYPATSLVVGLMANALGWRHHETEKLNCIQQRLQYASRQDRAGRKITDYQTVKLGHDFMLDTRAWTTRGKLDKRKGGEASSGTHIRLRDYYADAKHTVALTLQTWDETPTIDELANAFQFPERPLFIGRKNCLPSVPVFAELTEANTLLDALINFPAEKSETTSGKFRMWWPAEIQHPEIRAERTIPVTDKRDWDNQIHVGERLVSTAEVQCIVNQEVQNDK